MIPCDATTGWMPIIVRNVNGCEWCPEENRPAYTTDEHYKESTATWSVGTGKRNIHLCDSCAKLQRFKRMKHVPLKTKSV